MARGFIGNRVGYAVTMGDEGGIFSTQDNYYLNTLGPSLNVPFQASGGTTSPTARSGWITHIFTGDGTFVVSQGSADVEYLVVAGGGAGGGKPNIPGGGGAGGYRQAMPGQTTGGGGSADAVLTLGPGTYPISIGAGGPASSPNPADTRKGTPSYIGPAPAKTIESIGGGGGGDYAQLGGEGGSGGGSGQNGPEVGGAAVGPTTPATVQGYPGGFDPSTVPYPGTAAESGGGGGGAGSKGTDGYWGPGAGGYGGGGPGGNGHTSTISGSPVTLAGGGGGASHPASSGTYSGTPTVPTSPTTIGLGGPGGGGSGGRAPGTASGNAGSANTGGGGGGAVGTIGSGGAGGSGYVLIAYPQAA